MAVHSRLGVSPVFLHCNYPLVNLGNVKFYGESEFWLSIIKVTAVVAMIIFGIYLLVTAGPESTASLATFGHTVDSSHMALKAYFTCWPFLCLLLVALN